jgi:serine protease Do
MIANSAILDLAVLDTHVSSEHFLRLRHGGHPELGENVVNIGFPLQTLMTDAPTVTRGTLSSRAGLSGSVGQFQFSAPIQPGASGSPVIDARGDVLGVAVGTLNAGELLKQGVLPQNVNFALEAFYVEKFLQSRSVAFSEGLADPHASGNVPIDDVLPAVVGVKCYQ